MRLLLAFLALLAGMPSPSPAAVGASRQELAAFYRKDGVSNVRLAPDGRHLAYTIPDARDRPVLGIVDLDLPQKRAATVTNMPTRYVGWADAATLVFAVRNEIWAYDAEALAGSRKIADNKKFEYQDQGRAAARSFNSIQSLPGRPGQLVVTTPAATGTGTDFLLLDVHTGEIRRTGTAPSDRALTDRSGRPRLASLDKSAMFGRKLVLISPEGLRDDLDWFLGDLGGLRFNLAASDYFGEATVALGFGADPNLLYVASNAGRSRFGIYAIDVGARGGRRTPFAIEDETYDLAGPGDDLNTGRLVLDPAGELVGVRRLSPSRPIRWLDPGLAALAARAETQFPDRRVDVLGWAQDRSRLLLCVSGPADPGRYFLFMPRTGEFLEYLRSSPTPPTNWVGATTEFVFEPEPGRRLTGRIVLPRRPAAQPAPIVVYCRDFPAEPVETPYDPDAQALSALGFAVLEVDHRGTSGFGIAHRDAIKAGVDTVPLADIRAGIAWVAGRFPVNAGLVGIAGTGLGGFLAIRALELYPDEFRCAVAINAPADLGRWAVSSVVVADYELRARREYLASIPGVGGFAGLAGVGGLSAVRQSDRILKPVLLLENPNGALREAGGNENLRSALRRAGATVEYKSLSPAFDRGVPEARAAVIEDIGGFLRASFFDASVKLGAPRLVK